MRMSRMEKYHGNDAPVEKKPKQPKNKKRDKKTQRGSVAIIQPIAKVILFVIIMIAAFCLYEYRSGMRQARHDQGFKEIKVEDFKGEKSRSDDINVLLLGSDSRGEDMGRSDSIMIAHYNKHEKTPKLVSFMRDTLVNIPEVGYNKINAAYSYGGPELVRETIQQTFQVDVQYYAIVNFSSFPKVIDTLCPKGLEIDAEKDLNLDGVDIAKGVQQMDGHTALQYARFRKDEEGDFGRVRRQQQVMNALFQQGTSISNVAHLPKTLGKIQGYTTTNIPSSIYPSLVKDVVFKRNKPLEKLVIPVENSWENGYYDGAGSVLEIDEQMNAKAVQAFLN